MAAARGRSATRLLGQALIRLAKLAKVRTSLALRLFVE
jgi:hypothetical protein